MLSVKCENYNLVKETGLLEPEVNSEASKYIEENYDRIVKQIPKFGVSEEKSYDLLNDVYINLVKQEKDGRGYDPSIYGGDISLEQFIFGRIKKYSLSNEYREDIIEKKVDKNKNIRIEVVASSVSETNRDDMSNFQKQYEIAPSYDDIEEIEDGLSIQECIQYCSAFSDEIGLDLVQLFLNIEELDNTEICTSLFDRLKSRVIRTHYELIGELRGEFHTVATYPTKRVRDKWKREGNKIKVKKVERLTEFGEAFMNIMEYAKAHKDNFRSILANM